MKRLFTLLLIALTTLSCEMTDEKLDDLLDKRDWVVFADGTELTVDVPSKPTVLNYKFESTLDWEIKTDAEWLEINPTSGKAGKDIKIQIKVSKNKDKEGRTGYVDLTLSNEESYRITINQAGEGEENDEGDENENEGTIVDVPANQIWYTSTDGEIVEPYSGEDNNNADAATTFGAKIVSNTYKDGKGVIEFDGDVTKIGEWAFEQCESLTSVTIGNSVTEIGYGAFADCTSLTNITIPDSVTTIGNSAFVACASLTNITIPDSVTEIGYKAFGYCTSLTNITISDSVTKIGEGAFTECTSLASVAIPDSVTEIGYSAFESCTSLKEVYCKPTTPPTGGFWMFDNNASGRKIYVPMGSVEAYKSASYWKDYADSIVGEGDIVAGDIPNNEIWYTSTDGEIVEPYSGEYNEYADAITTFGVKIVSNTYVDGKGVIEFDGDVTEIGLGAFYDCTSLASVTIPDSVIVIKKGAFYGCINLNSVNIPDGVQEIGFDAFCGCTAIRTVTIPESVSFIDDGAFVICNGMERFNGKFASEDGRCLIIDGVLKAFAPAGLTEYTIPDNVTKIGHAVFLLYSNLENIIIPDSVTEIGNWAFQGCTSLASVTIGDSVTTIGVCAFQDCSSLTSVTIGDSVTTIGSSAFYNCSSLTSVTIPDSVTTVGGYAFSGCGNLNAVYITDLVAWCNIDFVNPINNGFQLEANPLAHAQNLYLNGELITELVIPESVTDIKFLAFIGCSASNIVFHDNVKSIGACAFEHCQNLENVVIGNSVESIGNVAFGRCPNLTSVTMSDSLTSFGFNVFLYSSNLREFKGKLATEDGRALIKDNILFTYANASGSEYTIPDGITIIGDGAFFSSVGLKSITIPKSVTTIGYLAFGMITDIESIYCKATTPPSTGGNIYESNSCNIYVPAESYQDYVSAEGWSQYVASILPYDYDNNCVVEVNASEETKRWLGKWSSTVSRTYCPQTGFNEETVTFDVNIEHNAVAPNFVKVYGLSVIDPTIAVDGIVNANGDLEILNFNYIGNSGEWGLYVWALSEAGGLTGDRHAVYTMSMDESGRVSCEVGSFNSSPYIVFDIFGYNVNTGGVSWYNTNISYYSGPMSWVKIADNGATPSRYSQKVPYITNFRPQADARLRVVE